MSPEMKKKVHQYFMVTLACAIMSIAMNTFYLPNKMLSGGIGGVARGGELSMDVSADLEEMARSSVAIISAGCNYWKFR